MYLFILLLRLLSCLLTALTSFAHWSLKLFLGLFGWKLQYFLSILCSLYCFLFNFLKFFIEAFDFFQLFLETFVHISVSFSKLLESTIVIRQCKLNFLNVAGDFILKLLCNTFFQVLHTLLNSSQILVNKLLDMRELLERKLFEICFILTLRGHAL